MNKNQQKMGQFHESVLVDEVIDGLKARKGARFIDATVGGGGHAKAIVEKGGEVLGIDQDTAAISEATRTLEKVQKQNEGIWKLVHGNFRHITEIAQKEGFEEVDGILFDLGVSTFQIKGSQRGFTFEKEELLDMRMNTKSARITAGDIINTSPKEELYEIFVRYGEEQRSRAIVRAIVRARSINPIRTTTELREIIEEIYGANRRKTNPATRVFQALRIAVNDELAALQEALPQIVTLLNPKGRVAIISFHSLEDRIVKLAFRNSHMKVITKKAIRPSKEEVQRNPRARSARLRIAEKIV